MALDVKYGLWQGKCNKTLEGPGGACASADGKVASQCACFSQVDCYAYSIAVDELPHLLLLHAFSMQTYTLPIASYCSRSFSCCINFC